jgi:hypothetical protein
VDLLLTCWPVALRGQAIITTRNPNLAFFPADRGLENTTTKRERSLLKMMPLFASNSLTDTGAEGADELPAEQVEYALASSLADGVILHRSWAADEYLD